MRHICCSALGRRLPGDGLQRCRISLSLLTHLPPTYRFKRAKQRLHEVSAINIPSFETTERNPGAESLTADRAPVQVVMLVWAGCHVELLQLSSLFFNTSSKAAPPPGTSLRFDVLRAGSFSIRPSAHGLDTLGLWNGSEWLILQPGSSLKPHRP